MSEIFQIIPLLTLQRWVCSLWRCWCPLNLHVAQLYQNSDCLCLNSVPRDNLHSRSQGMSGETHWTPFSLGSLFSREDLGFFWVFFSCVVCVGTLSARAAAWGARLQHRINSCRASSTFTWTRAIYGAKIISENNNPHGKPYFSTPCVIFPYLVSINHTSVPSSS